MYLYFALIFVVILYLLAVVKIRKSNSNLPEIYEFLLLIPLVIILVGWHIITGKGKISMYIGSGIVLLLTIIASVLVNRKHALPIVKNAYSNLPPLLLDIQMISVVVLIGFLIGNIDMSVDAILRGTVREKVLILVLYALQIYGSWQHYRMYKNSFPVVFGTSTKTSIMLSVSMCVIYLISFATVSYYVRNEPPGVNKDNRKSNLKTALMNLIFGIITAYIYVKLKKYHKSNRVALLGARMLLIISLLFVVLPTLNYTPPDDPVHIRHWPAPEYHDDDSDNEGSIGSDDNVEFDADDFL